MLTCWFIQKALSSYLDGELPAARVARLEAHLRVCQHCRKEMAALQGINDHIRAASRNLAISQDFDQRVLRAVGYFQVRTARRQREPMARPLVILALLLLALFGVVRYYLRPPAQGGRPEKKPAVQRAP